MPLVAAIQDPLLAQAVADCNRRLPAPLPDLEVRVERRADDTLRETTELGLLLDASSGPLAIPVWESDRLFTPDLEKKYRSWIHKRAAVLRDGPARTLGDLVRLETDAMRFCDDMPLMWPGGWEKAFASRLAASDLPTIVACWYGDAAARKLGYEPLGFPEGAGRIFSRARASNAKLPA